MITTLIHACAAFFHFAIFALLPALWHSPKYITTCKAGGFLSFTKFVSYKDLKKVCVDLKQIYSAATEEAGRKALEEFGEIWNGKYPMIFRSWETHWDDLSEFFKYPPEIRHAIYTTNAVESLNYQLRKVTKNRSIFSTDEAILKILYLAIRNASEKWTVPIRNWGQALNQFAIEFGNGRVPLL